MSRFHRIPLALLIAVALSSASEPLRQTLLALERADIEAFKSKDTNFPTSYLADTFIGYGASGKIDKATASKQYASHNCTLQSHFIASEQLTQLDTDVALLTYKKSLNGTCGAEALPAESSSANVFVRKARKWQSIFYAESAIVAPAVIAPNRTTLNHNRTRKPSTQRPNSSSPPKKRSGKLGAIRTAAAYKLSPLRTCPSSTSSVRVS